MQELQLNWYSPKFIIWSTRFSWCNWTTCASRRQEDGAEKGQKSHWDSWDGDRLSTSSTEVRSSLLRPSSSMKSSVSRMKIKLFFLLVMSSFATHKGHFGAMFFSPIDYCPFLWSVSPFLWWAFLDKSMFPEFVSSSVRPSIRLLVRPSKSFIFANNMF